MWRLPILTLSLLVAAPGEVVAKQNSKFHIVFVFGQSNGEPVGQGPADDALELTTIDRQIMQVGRYGVHDMKPVRIGGLRAGDDGLHNYRRVRGHGFVTSFARKYVEDGYLPDGYKVLIVLGSCSGISVLNWLDEIPQPDRCPDPYGDLVTRLQYAASLADTKIVAGLLALGEQDTLFAIDGKHSMTAQLFRTKLGDLLTKLRSDVPQDPAYPIIAHQMVPTWNPGNLATKNAFNSAITAAMRNDDELGDVASVSGLQSNFDARQNASKVHYDAGSMTLLGRRMYARWQALQ